MADHCVQQRAMGHVMRAQQLLNSQYSFGKPPVKERSRSSFIAREHDNRRTVRIRTVQDVHDLKHKSKHLSSKKVHKELVRALLANVGNELMVREIGILLRSVCSTCSKQNCTSGESGSCEWSQSWLSWILRQEGKCQVIPALDMLTTDLPKSIIGSALALVRLLRVLNNEVNMTNANSTTEAIRNACVKFANKQNAYIGYKGIQQEYLPIIQNGMRKKGMIANAKFIDKHVLPSLVELDENAYNVQLIYISMQIYFELFDKILLAIKPENPIWVMCNRILTPHLKWCESLSKDQTRIGESAARAVVILATALFYASETQDATNLSMLFVLIKALPPCINVLKYQINMLKHRSKVLGLSIASELNCAMRCVYGKGVIYRNETSFGSLAELSTLLTKDGISVSPTSQPILMISSASKEREEEREILLSTIGGSRTLHRLEGVPLDLRNRSDFGSDYMELMSRYKSLGKLPISKWPLLGTSDSIANHNTFSLLGMDSQRMSVSAQLNAGVRLLTVHPHLQEFNVDGTPVVKFHSNSTLNASYDIHNLIGDVMNFLDDHAGEVVTVYFKNFTYDKQIDTDPQGAMQEILDYFFLHVPDNKLILKHHMAYNELRRKGQQLLIRTDSSNQDAATIEEVQLDFFQSMNHLFKEKNPDARTVVVHPKMLFKNMLGIIASMAFES